jgi:TRAP-type mannitol/chloroaromatic compound transport system substrate-binding protein
MRPDRRAALGAIAAGFSAAALPAPAIAQSRIEWRMITSWPRNLPGPGVTAQRLADRITRASGGRLTVTLFAAGEIAPALEVLTQVGRGTAQMGHTAALFWAGRMPAAPLFTAGPFGLLPLEHMAWIGSGGGQTLWDELYAGEGVKPFMAGNTGIQMGGWFNREISSAADLSGLKMRIPGLAGLVMQKLGAVPVTIAPGEIVPALQTGVIDAAEFLGPFSDLASGFHKAAKYYYSPGWHEPNGTGEAIVSLDAWTGLPDDLKAVVEQACAAENAFALAEAEWLNGEALKALRETPGVELREFPADMLAAARTAASEVLDELASRDAMSARIVESWRAAVAHQRDWSKISLSALLAARA